jgi:hypothetical protein
VMNHGSRLMKLDLSTLKHVGLSDTQVFGGGGTAQMGVAEGSDTGSRSAARKENYISLRPRPTRFCI